MEENFYKEKYFKYKAKYYKLLEQSGGMGYQEFRQRFPPEELDGFIYTNPYNREDKLTEKEIEKMYNEVTKLEKERKEQQIRKQQIREQQIREQQIREQQIREQQIREQQIRSVNPEY